MTVNSNISTAEALIKRLGLNNGGRVSARHTQNIANRITKYQPYRTFGSVPKATMTGVDIANCRIVIRGPHINYLNEGKAWAGKKPKHRTNKDLVYTKSPNRLAGPHWVERMMELEGGAIAADLANDIKRSL